MVTMEAINMYTCTICTTAPPPPHPNRPTTVLVSVMLANNETGIIMVRSQLISNSSYVVVCTKELQWSLSIEDTIRTQLSVLYGAVSLVQR